MSEKDFLLVDDSEDALEVLELFVESEFDNELITATSGNEAIELLDKDGGDYAIVVSDYNMPDGNGAALFQHIKDKGYKVPFLLLCGEDQATMEKVPEFEPLTKSSVTSFITKPFKKDVVVEAINENLNDEEITEGAPSKAVKVPEGFKKISIDKFFKYSMKRLNVFIKLSDVKFVKIIEEEDDDPKEIVEKYARKGITHLFLETESYESFMKNISKKLTDVLAGSVKDVGKTLDAQMNSVDAIHEGLRNLGVSAEAMELAEKSVGATLKVLKKSPNLSVLLNQMMKNKNYIYELSMINSYLSTAIAKETDWASEKTYDKLAMASLIMDISLESEDLAKIISLDSPEFKNLSQEFQDEVADHPHASVKLLDEAEDFSSDCRNIILEHHELPEGKGFPRKLNQTKISPLSCIMIISQHYARTVLLEGHSAEVIDKIKIEISKDFNKGNFKKPCAGFLKAIEK